MPHVTEHHYLVYLAFERSRSENLAGIADNDILDNLNKPYLRVYSDFAEGRIHGIKDSALTRVPDGSWRPPGECCGDILIMIAGFRKCREGKAFAGIGLEIMSTRTQ